MSRPVPDPDALARLERRAERERRARHEAERLLEQKSMEQMREFLRRKPHGIPQI